MFSIVLFLAGLLIGWSAIHVHAAIRAPATLSNPSATAAGWSDVRGSVTTDTGSGTLYYIASTNTSVPTAANIRACKDAGGASVLWCAKVAIRSAGTKFLLKLGSFANGAALSSVTNYKMFFVQNTAKGDSN